MLRTYAKTVALGLVTLAVAGVTILGWRLAPSFYHAGLGLLFGYVGFFAPDRGTVRPMVFGLGVLVLVTKTLMVLGVWAMFDHLSHDPIAVTCFVVGVASILASIYLPDGHDEGT